MLAMDMALAPTKKCKGCKEQFCSAGQEDVKNTHQGYCEECTVKRKASNALRQARHKGRLQVEAASGTPCTQLVLGVFETELYVRYHHSRTTEVLATGTAGYMDDLNLLTLFIKNHPKDKVRGNGMAPAGDSFNGVDEINGKWAELRTLFSMGSSNVLEWSIPEVSMK
jgi:hypothetical protein